MGMHNLAFVGIDLQRQLVQHDRPEFVVAHEQLPCSTVSQILTG